MPRWLCTCASIVTMLWRCLGLAFKVAAVAFVAFPFFLSFFLDAMDEGRMPGSEAAVVGKCVGPKMGDDQS